MLGSAVDTCSASVLWLCTNFTFFLRCGRLESWSVFSIRSNGEVCPVDASRCSFAQRGSHWETRKSFYELRLAELRDDVRAFSLLSAAFCGLLFGVEALPIHTSGLLTKNISTEDRVKNNNNNNTIWGGSVLTGEEPPPHSGELKHALSQAGGPTQSQLSRPMSSGHHISMEHRPRRKQLNSDTNASNKTYLKEIQEKRREETFSSEKMKERKWKTLKNSRNEEMNKKWEKMKK